MDPKIVRDEYGRPFYLYSEAEWNNSGTLNWGKWEPVAFSELGHTEKGERENGKCLTASEEDAKLITEAVIQEASSFMEEINNLTLSAPNEERERIYKLIEAVAYAMREYIENYNKC